MTRRAEGGVRVREGGEFPEDAVRGRVDPHLAFEPSRVDFVVVFLVTPTTESGRGIVPDSRVFGIVSVCVEVELLELTQERGVATPMVQFQHGWVSL